MSYHDVPPRSIGKTVLSTLTHTLADLTTRSKLVSLEAAVPVAKEGSYFSTVEAEVSLLHPFVFDKINGFISITASGSFRVIITDNLTAESVNLYVDRMFVFHGLADCQFTVQTDTDMPLKVTIIRVC